MFCKSRKWVCILIPLVQMSREVNIKKYKFFKKHPLKKRSRFKQVKGVFTMPRLSKKAKQEWDFFINPETGRRTYNSLCLKCKNKCKQSHKAIVVFCPKYKSKRGAKSIKNRREYDDSG
jgi:hypothetical protein